MRQILSAKRLHGSQMQWIWQSTSLVILVIAVSGCPLTQNPYAQIAQTSPQLVRQIVLNEVLTEEAMREIHQAEQDYKAARYTDEDGDGTGDYGTLADLAIQEPPLIGAELGSGQKNGYLFTLVVALGGSGSSPQYTCTAVPAQFWVDGVRQYFIDETGVLRYTEDGTVPDATSTAL